MKRLLVPALACLVLAACSSPEEEAVDLTNELAEILEGVTDEASANDAVDDIEDVLSRLLELKKELGDRKKEDVSDELKKEGMEAGMRMGKAMANLAKHPKALKIIQKAMAQMPR